VTGYVILLAATLVYCAITQPWDTALTWLVLGTIFVFLPVLLGGFCGLLGAFVSKFTQSRLARWFAG
jgi:hypothetical protein